MARDTKRATVMNVENISYKMKEVEKVGGGTRAEKMKERIKGTPLFSQHVKKLCTNTSK